jgi:FPC/CPF motif-containing protein YcgG
VARVHVIPIGAIIHGAKDVAVLAFSGSGHWLFTRICKDKTEARNLSIAIRNRLKKKEGKKRG